MAATCLKNSALPAGIIVTSKSGLTDVSTAMKEIGSRISGTRRSAPPKPWSPHDDPQTAVLDAGARGLPALRQVVQLQRDVWASYAVPVKGNRTMPALRQDATDAEL